MDTIDFKNTLPSYRARHSVFDAIDVPPLQYLMINGNGDPNSSPDFTSAIETLYPLAYAMEFFSKNELGQSQLDHAATMATRRRVLPASAITL